MFEFDFLNEMANSAYEKLQNMSIDDIKADIEKQQKIDELQKQIDDLRKG